MRTVLRMPVVLLSLLALVLAAGAQAVRPAPAAAAVPCQSFVVSADRSGVLSALALRDNAAVASYTSGGSTFPFGIRSITTFRDATLNGTEATESSGHLVLTSNGDLYQATLAWDHAHRTVRYREAMLLNRTFDGFREIAFGESSRELYAIHQNGNLYRYTLGQFYEPLRGTVVGTGWTAMHQLRPAPMNYGQKGTSTDTLVAVSSRTGQLVAYTFDRTRPRYLGSVVLGQRGWAPMLLVEDRCSRNSLIAIHRTTRDAFLYRQSDVDAPWTTVRAVRQIASRWWARPLTTA